MQEGLHDHQPQEGLHDHQPQDAVLACVDAITVHPTSRLWGVYGDITVIHTATNGRNSYTAKTVTLKYPAVYEGVEQYRSTSR